MQLVSFFLVFLLLFNLEDLRKAVQEAREDRVEISSKYKLKMVPTMLIAILRSYFMSFLMNFS